MLPSISLLHQGHLAYLVGKTEARNIGRVLYSLALWTELCPCKIPMLKSSGLVSHNVTDKDLKEIIMLKIKSSR